jgi:hypothetical protein
MPTGGWAVTRDFMLQLALSLFAASIALGLLSYIVVLNRRSRENGTGDDADKPTQGDTEMNDKKPTQDPANEQKKPSAPLEHAVSIASLLRDQKTGQLIVKVGDQDYSKAADIEEPAVRASLEIAAADLLQWLSLRIDIKPSPEKAAPGTPEKAAARPKSMIEEINEILERRSDMGDAPQGLRLFEGLEGTARVYVGVDSYEVDEVPDKKILRVIKEAVAEWEALQ